MGQGHTEDIFWTYVGHILDMGHCLDKSWDTHMGNQHPIFNINLTCTHILSEVGAIRCEEKHNPVQLSVEPYPHFDLGVTLV